MSLLYFGSLDGSGEALVWLHNHPSIRSIWGKNLSGFQIGGGRSCRCRYGRETLGCLDKSCSFQRAAEKVKINPRL